MRKLFLNLDSNLNQNGNNVSELTPLILIAQFLKCLKLIIQWLLLFKIPPLLTYKKQEFQCQMEIILSVFSIKNLKISKIHLHLLFVMKIIYKMEQILNHVLLILIF